GNKSRLELRRREVNPLGQHAVKEFPEPLAVAVHRVGEVVNRTIGEVSAKHRAATIELHGHFRGPGRVFHSRFKLRAELFEPRVGALFGVRISDFGVQSYWLALTQTLSPRRGNSPLAHWLGG